MMKILKAKINQPTKQIKNRLVGEYKYGHFNIVDHNDSFDFIAQYPSDRKPSGYRNIVLNFLESPEDLKSELTFIRNEIELSRSVIKNEGIINEESIKNPDTLNRYFAIKELIGIIG